MPLAKGEPPLPAGINMSCVLEYNTIAKEVAAEVGGVIIDDLYVIRHHRHHHFSHRFSRGSQLYIATHTHTHTCDLQWSLYLVTMLAGCLPVT